MTFCYVCILASRLPLFFKKERFRQKACKGFETETETETERETETETETEIERETERELEGMTLRVRPRKREIAEKRVDRFCLSEIQRDGGILSETQSFRNFELQVAWFWGRDGPRKARSSVAAGATRTREEGRRRRR